MAAFFGLTFAITWGLQAPAVFSSHPERWMALVGLGAFGPMLAAMIVSPSLRDLFRPLAIWRVSPIWYALALFVPGATFVVAAAIYGHGEPRLYPPSNAAFVAAAIVFPIGEEIGWRGFALPHLNARVGPLWASVVIGVVWTLWHIPMMTIQGASSPALYAAYFPFMIGGSIFFTWIWQNARRSLLLMVLAHVGAHLNNSGHALPARVTPIILHAMAMVVLAIVLVVFDEKLRVTSP